MEQKNTRNRLDAVNTEILTPLVQRVLTSRQATITEWHGEPVKGDGSVGKRFVCRFHGWASLAGDSVPWSLFLKVPNPTHTAFDPWHREPFQREVLLYESGLLESLPGGIVAPRCLQVMKPPDDESWMWLEDVAGQSALQWPLARFRTAVFHFGRMQGAFLVSRTLPNRPWLATDEWLRPRLLDTMQEIPSLLHQLSAHPATHRLFGSDFGKRLNRLWAERNSIYESLGRMPRSLCHGDFNYMNLLAPCELDSESQTFVVDWQYTGVRSIGEDIAGLIADSSVVPVRRKVAEPEELTELLLESYLDGIRESGWRGNLNQVRFACIARLAYVWSFWSILGWGNELLSGPLLDVTREAFSMKLDEHIHTHGFLFRLADEARTLMGENAW